MAQSKWAALVVGHGRRAPTLLHQVFMKPLSPAAPPRSPARSSLPSDFPSLHNFGPLPNTKSTVQPIGDPAGVASGETAEHGFEVGLWAFFWQVNWPSSLPLLPKALHGRREQGCLCVVDAAYQYHESRPNIGLFLSEWLVWNWRVTESDKDVRC